MINFLFRQSTLWLLYTAFSLLTAIYWYDEKNLKEEATMLLCLAVFSAVCYWFTMKIEKGRGQ
jgi:hypothetical protein